MKRSKVNVQQQREEKVQHQSSLNQDKFWQRRRIEERVEQRNRFLQ